MAAMQDLVDEVERSFAETQERLSDPSVYNDHREAAEVGRRLKELEGPHKLAQEWLGTQAELPATRDGPGLRPLLPRLARRRGGPPGAAAPPPPRGGPTRARRGSPP